MKEAHTANKLPNPLNINDVRKLKEDNFKLAIDYYSEDNPFTKIIIGSTVGAVGSFTTTIISLGMTGAYISGGIFFYDTAFLVGGYAAIGTALSLIVAVPAILGGIGYGIYKFVKSNQVKNYMEKVSNNESATEEREILSRLTQECINYFKNYIVDEYKRMLKYLIEKDTLEIIKLIKGNLDISNNSIKNLIMREINEMNFYNIILIGNTGVGKSTLINGFLRLKNNKAKEGDTAEPQKIDNWPKKYPISENDS